MVIDYGVPVKPAGERVQSHDLEIEGPQTAFLRIQGLRPGKYEIKSLWRKNECCKFDRRFKVGMRGEKIYGRRDLEIKAFAEALETEVDSVLEHSLTSTKMRPGPGELIRFVIDVFDFVDLAMERKHSKRFDERLRRLAKASLGIPRITARAHFAFHGNVQGHDIVRGFDDIEGIFVVAGPTYTLVTRKEISDFLSFDSSSAEGPKIRFTGVIPSEIDNVREKKGKVRNV